MSSHSRARIKRIEYIESSDSDDDSNLEHLRKDTQVKGQQFARGDDDGRDNCDDDNSDSDRNRSVDIPVVRISKHLNHLDGTSSASEANQSGHYSKYANRSAYGILNVDDSRKKTLYENALVNQSSQRNKDYIADSYRSKNSQLISTNVVQSDDDIKSHQPLKDASRTSVVRDSRAISNLSSTDTVESSIQRQASSVSTTSNNPTPSTYEPISRQISPRSLWKGRNTAFQSVVPEPSLSKPQGPLNSQRSVEFIARKNQDQGDVRTEASDSTSSPVSEREKTLSASSSNESPIFCRRIQTTSYLNAIRFARGSVPKVLCASSDSTIHVYGVSKGQTYPPMEGHTDRVISLAVSNPFYTFEDNSENSSSSNSSSNSSSSNSSSNSNRGKDHNGKRKVLKTLVASGSRDEILKIWDLDSGRCLFSIHAHSSPIWTVSIAVRKDGNILVVSGAADGTLRSWDGRTGKRVMNFKAHAQKILTTFIVNPSSDSPYLLSAGCEKCIHVWDLVSGRHLRMLEGHEDEVTTVCAGSFPGLASLTPISGAASKAAAATAGSLGDNSSSNNGVVVVSGSRDLSVRVWHFNSGLLLFEMFGHTGCIYEVSLLRCMGKVLNYFFF